MTPNTAVAVRSALPAFAMPEEELIKVLCNSLYPGASEASAKMVLGYCQASGLDPMQKPVHIVPMDLKSGEKDGEGKDVYSKRDVIMPGVGLYRSQAESTGAYAGMSEPEFGPMKTLKFREEFWENRTKHQREAEIEYPEWCRITVKKIVAGHIAEFTAVEYWIENYATASRYTNAPNAMWKKRVRGQLAKCTEAQALRKAFPNVGSAPTAEEMEGKSLMADGDDFVIEGTSTRIQTPQRRSEPTAAAQPPSAEPKKDPPPKETAKDAPKDDAAQPGGPLMTDGMKKTIRARLKASDIPEEKIATQFGEPLDKLPASLVNNVLAWITEMKEAAQS